MGHVYCFYSCFSSPQISSTSSRNPQRPNGAAKSATETRGKRLSIVSHTALRRSTTAKSPGYQDGYEKVRCGTFKGIRKGIKKDIRTDMEGVMRTENLQGHQKRYQEAMGTFLDIRKDM